MHLELALLFGLLVALSNAVAVTTQHVASRAIASGTAPSQLLRRLVTSPLWLLGWIALGGSLLFQALALHFGSLSVVQPLLVSELVITLVVRRVWLRQSISTSAWRWSALTSASLGCFLWLVATNADSTQTTARWLTPSSTTFVVVSLLIAASWRQSPVRKAGLLGSATGILWAIEAAFIKAVTAQLSLGWAILAHPALYAFVGCGLFGLWCEQSALRAGPLRISQTALVVVDPLASVALGVAIYGDQIAHTKGELVIACGLLAIIAWSALRTSKVTPELTATINR